MRVCVCVPLWLSLYLGIGVRAKVQEVEIEAYFEKKVSNNQKKTQIIFPYFFNNPRERVYHKGLGIFIQHFSCFI